MKVSISASSVVKFFCAVCFTVIFINNASGPMSNRRISRTPAAHTIKPKSSFLRGFVKGPITVVPVVPTASGLSHNQDDWAYGVSESTPGNLTEPLDLKCTQGDINCSIAQERLKEEQKSFSLSEVYPHGGGTLPNYFLRGIDRGMTPRDYRNGIIGFLHHNKASGTSVKTCMSVMGKKGILPRRSFLVVSNGQLSKLSMTDMMKNDVFLGDHIFGFCEHFEGRNCSYFTFLRDPYDRLLSSYFYCKSHLDQLCGPLNVNRFTLPQWAVYQGSYFFYQLLMDPQYCTPNQVINDLLLYSQKDYSRLTRTGRKHITPTTMCWFKQRVYLEAYVNETGREHLLQNILENLENWFSLIGLTEDYDLSLDMLSAAYGLPFSERCRGKVRNPSSVKNPHKDLERQKLKFELMASPEVAKALHFDISIYEKARELFERQRRKFKELKRKTSS